jgi:DNA-binding FadR family transcriptional regulator
MDLHPVSRTSVADAVFEQLSSQIVAGTLPIGAALPAERALTEALGVNRQAVREALKRLAQAGLVEVRHGDATRVRDFHRSAGLDLLPSLLVGAGGVVDPAVVRSIMEMRATIGPDLAGWCAVRATPEQVARLRATADLMAAAAPDDLATLARLDLDFWDELVEGADNIAYRLALNSLRRVVELAGPPLHAVLAGELRDQAGHEAILAAIEAGDGPGATAMAARLLAQGTAAINGLLAGLPPVEGTR